MCIFVLPIPLPTKVKFEAGLFQVCRCRRPLTDGNIADTAKHRIAGKIRARHGGNSLEFPYRRSARRRKGGRQISSPVAFIPTVGIVATDVNFGRITFGLGGLEDGFVRRAGEPSCRLFIAAAERFPVRSCDGRGARAVPTATPSLVIVLDFGDGFIFLVFSGSGT